MRQLFELAPSLIAVIILAAIAWVLIFHRAYLTEACRSLQSRLPQRAFEIIVAMVSGLALFALYLVLNKFALSVSSFLHYLWAAPTAGLSNDKIAAANALHANRIQFVTTAIQAVGGLAVLIGIGFAWSNLRATQKYQAETLRLTNEGQITDRFSRAIDQLGHGQLEVRLGAIYALERIARDSEKDHWPIMEVLTAYVRMHAPIEGVHAPTDEADENTSAAPLAQDIQAILTVIGRRKWTYGNGEDERLNLARTSLEKADLRHAHLEGADLSGAILRGADLEFTNLHHAYLTRANLRYADLTSAILSRADLSGADLCRANLDTADLGGAIMWDANLRGADPTGANLSEANLSNADLSGANLSGANLRDASLAAADLSEARNLTQDQINSAKGDEHTKLPANLVMPESWKKPG